MLALTKIPKMGGGRKKNVRFGLDSQGSMGSESEVPLRNFSSMDSSSSGMRRGWEKGSRGLFRLGQSLKFKTSAQVFDKDAVKDERWKYLDPSSPRLHKWNTFFVASCLVAVSVDPLFFFLPVVDYANECIEISKNLKVSVTVFRTTTDFIYMIHMFLRFRTAFTKPSTRVLGRGELVTDPYEIAVNYLRKDFWIDFVAVLPVPQIVIWWLIPSLHHGTQAIDTKNALRFIITFQYIPRLLRIFPLLSKMINTTGVLLETAWAGAAFNLLLYMLASHVVGACWYILSVERQDTCWRQGNLGNSAFNKRFLDCASLSNPALNASRSNWFTPPNSSSPTDCSNSGGNFNYGIYKNAIAMNITTKDIPFPEKYLYSLWTGLLSLSSLTQTLSVSTFVWEIIFTILIIIIGLLLFAFLIGNMQTYLQSLTLRLEEMRVKRRDTEQWMRHRNLTPEIVTRVRRYDQYKWVATRGVDEEDLLQSLPSDLRRDIKRQLCLELVRKVPFCEQMDGSLLDAMCERLKPALCTEGTVILREGDPVNEMFFVIRGQLESMTHNGAQSGLFNYVVLGVGDFCGDELLTWALDPKPQNHLPVSTHTVKALKEVEAFSLSADDLKFVASQFRKLHSRQLQHTFRYYSHHWRTWGASFIQAAWRRYQRRRYAEHRRKEEEDNLKMALEGVEETRGNISLGATVYSARFASNAMRGIQRLRSMRAAELTRIQNIPKPTEPDFSAD